MYGGHELVEAMRLCSPAKEGSDASQATLWLKSAMQIWPFIRCFSLAFAFAVFVVTAFGGRGIARSRRRDRREQERIGSRSERLGGSPATSESQGLVSRAGAPLAVRWAANSGTLMPASGCSSATATMGMTCCWLNGNAGTPSSISSSGTRGSKARRAITAAPPCAIPETARSDIRHNSATPRMGSCSASQPGRMAKRSPSISRKWSRTSA